MAFHKLPEPPYVLTNGIFEFFVLSRTRLDWEYHAIRYFSHRSYPMQHLWLSNDDLKGILKQNALVVKLDVRHGQR